MIKKTVKLTAEDVKSILMFGNGDIGISVLKSRYDMDSKPTVSVAFGELTEKKKVGEEVSDCDRHNKPDVIMLFNDEKSIDVLIEQFKEAKKVLGGIEKDRHAFVVPIENIIIPQDFARSNPHAEKVMERLNSYKETGKFSQGIVCDSHLILNDGYITYIVAKYLGLKEIEVAVEDGIIVQIDDDVMTFTEPAVCIDVESYYGRIHLSLSCGSNSTRIYVKSISDAAKLVKKISSIFDAEFSFKRNSGLNQELRKALIDQKINSTI